MVSYLRIRNVDAVMLRLSDEIYERDALAVKGGAEHPMEVLLVIVETDSGLIGYGESVSYGSLYAVYAAVKKVLVPMLRGHEVDGIADLWDRMYKATFRLGRRGIMISAMSGIDIALWDLLGKELGAPIYRLLGGRAKRIKGYITGGYYREGKDIRKLVEEVKNYVKQGFKTVKIKVGGVELAEDIRRLRAIREEFGDSLEIAVDANNVYSFNEALKAGREFEKLGVIFFEEPIMTDFPDLSAELARTLEIPIAGFETAYTLYEFRELISKRAVDIVQADAAWNGGITEMHRIGVMARAYGLPLIPHYSAGGVGFVASLHVALAIGSPMVEYHLRPNKLREGLAGDAIKYENGEFLPPAGPGLGIKPSEKVIEEYNVKE
jgi:D-arabinonate dehydratase